MKARTPDLHIRSGLKKLLKRTSPPHSLGHPVV